MSAVVAMIAMLGAGAIGQPCEDVTGERLALVQAVKSDARFADLAAALEQRVGAPLAAGIEMDGPAPEAAAALGERLEMFCARARTSGSAALRPGDREHLAEIFSRPEFGQARSPDVNGLARLVAWLTAWMDVLFETSGAQSFARGTRVLVLALAIAVVLGVGFRLASARRNGRVKKEIAGAAASPGQVLEAPEAHLARGGAIVEADPREAIREGLLALLASLERRSLARPDRVKTNREVAEEMVERGAAPQICERVRGLLGWYDRTYYSLERPAPSDAQRFLHDVMRLAMSLHEKPA